MTRFKTTLGSCIQRCVCHRSEEGPRTEDGMAEYIQSRPLGWGAVRNVWLQLLREFQ